MPRSLHTRSRIRGAEASCWLFFNFDFSSRYSFCITRAACLTLMDRLASKEAPVSLLFKCCSIVVQLRLDVGSTNDREEATPSDSSFFDFFPVDLPPDSNAIASAGRLLSILGVSSSPSWFSGLHSASFWLFMVVEKKMEICAIPPCCFFWEIRWLLGSVEIQRTEN